MRYFDCHSHFLDASRACITRTAEEYENAQRVFKRKREFETEEQMAETFRSAQRPHHSRHLPHLAYDGRG